ncbi:MAG TPA: hypothetical protein VEF72_32220 [Mycobacterium sp.]|nr:hypothetical protein [Mycobacterium sp.]
MLQPNIVQDVRTHLEEIRDQTHYTVPKGPADEMAELYKVITTG